MSLCGSYEKLKAKDIHISLNRTQHKMSKHGKKSIVCKKSSHFHHKTMLKVEKI